MAQVMVMDSVNNMDELAAKIKKLEQREAVQMSALRTQVNETIEGLRPVNLVKSAFSNITASKTMKQGALNAAIGVGAGMLVKSIITYKSNNLFRKMAGYALQLITTKVVAGKLPFPSQRTADAE